jgi:carboxylesterase type B
MTYFIVPTTDGNIKGRQTKTKSNFSYYAFYKIPFAKPPVGDLRFNIIISYLSYRVI